MAARKKPSPKQLAARRKFAAMAKARSKKAAGRKRTKNPAKHSRAPKIPKGRFQVAALKGTKVLYFSGIALTDNRSAAVNFPVLAAARSMGQKIRKVAPQLGVTRIAVVTAHDSPASVAGFLRGKT